MSAVDWSSLPLLPLKCVLDHLSLEDALAATSTCRNWRQALFLYEGRRETLKLRVGELRRSLFLIELFKKYTQRLHIYIDNSLGNRHAYEYLQAVVPKFYDAALLYEITFIGSVYVDKSRTSKADFKLNRALIETLIHVHRHTLQNFALFGCVLSSEKECCLEDKKHFGNRSLSFLRPAQMMLVKHNMKMPGLSSLKHLLLEYEMLDQDTVESLSTLPHLTDLSLQLRDKTEPWQPLSWTATQNNTNPLQVALNIIEVPSKKFEQIIQNVLVDDLPLVALRVLFCKTLHEALIKHVTRHYHSRLRELEWTDAPAEAPLPSAHCDEHDDPCINPFILICWRCSQLEKLVIHGYWIWQYDLLGMVRLRYNSLQWLEVSATSGRDKRDCALDCDVSAVRAGERACHSDVSTVQEINRYLQFPWRPLRRWNKLHPALLARCTAADRSRYVLDQISPLFGVT